MLKRKTIFFFLVLAVGFYGPIFANKPDHSSWDELLQTYVDDAGNVDYKGFLTEKAQLQDYLDVLGQSIPDSDWDRKETLAYYINLYNAATVALVLDHYPIQSIKEIPNRWKRKWIALGGKTISLNDIEHKILRKMEEPRIHFAINCASYSCPKLLNQAFTSDNLERLLDKAAVDFVNDPKRNRFEGNRAELSQIFKWYKPDFIENGSLRSYVNLFVRNPLGKATKITFMDYDWRLNEK
ncbi:MAG: DUF547 domain-containing protein [Bacteroidota bacterium]